MRGRNPYAPVFLTRLAVAVIQQAVEDLDSPDEKLRLHARDFLLGSDTLPLEKWLVLTGVCDAEEFTESLLRKRKKEKLAA